jgi:hypothetical protein
VKGGRSELCPQVGFCGRNSGLFIAHLLSQNAKCHSYYRQIPEVNVLIGLKASNNVYNKDICVLAVVSNPN